MTPLNEWIRFFFGTPKRFLWSALVVGLVVVTINPGLLQSAVVRLLQELTPLIGPLLSILIIIVALRVIVGGFKK